MALGISTVVVVISMASLACLILATITAPASSSLALAEAEGISYGVLGYCFSDNSTCIVGSPSYKPSALTSLSDWKMDDSARDTLAKILVITPVAAGLTLISLFFNLLLHFKAIGGSFAVCLISFIFTLLTFFASAITVIIVFLLFYPHVKWPSWILIVPGVLSLIAIPLSFFALRTLPYNSAEEDNEYDDNKNLTDLSDGDIFKANESFQVDSQVPEPSFSTASFQKPSGYSSIKINHDDSSTSLDKVSIHDTSKNNTSGYGGYQAYTAHTSGSTKSGLDDGAPHIVSSKDYLTAGSVRSEAPNFDSKSAKPEFTASPFPSSQYTGIQPKGVPTYQPSNRSGPQNIVPVPQGQVFTSVRPGFGSNSNSYNISNSGSTGRSNPNEPTSSNNNASSNFAAASNQGSSNLNSGFNVITPSRGASISDDIDDDGLIINDDDSDFTSVSQRAANPKYFRSIQNHGPTLFPKQQPQGPQQSYNQPDYPQQGYPQQGSQQGYPRQGYPQQSQTSQPVQYQSSAAPQSGYPQQSYPPQAYAQEENTTQNYTQQGYHQPVFGAGNYQQQRAHRGPPKDTSSALLNANPDFSIGPASSRSAPVSKRINPNTGGSYKPAYRRVNNANSGTLPPASLSADSPYNFR